MHCRVCFTKHWPIPALKIPNTQQKLVGGGGQKIIERELSYLAAPYSGGC